MILQGDFKAKLYWKVKSISLQTSIDKDKTSLMLYINHAGLVSVGEGNTKVAVQGFWSHWLWSPASLAPLHSNLW